jgi:hypothetical protein
MNANPLIKRIPQGVAMSFRDEPENAKIPMFSGYEADSKEINARD